jgi:hypothetical protein
MKNMLRLLCIIQFATGCGYGMYLEGCQRDAAVEQRMVAAADFLGVDEVLNRMDFFCKESLSGPCRRDVDACTQRVGSSIARGRTFVKDDIPLDNAVCHEGLHWALWAQDPCATHDAECGWDPTLVDDCNNFSEETINAE